MKKTKITLRYILGVAIGMYVGYSVFILTALMPVFDCGYQIPHAGCTMFELTPLLIGSAVPGIGILVFYLCVLISIRWEEK